MYVLLFLALVVVVYIASFKENFTQEKLDKIVPIFAIGTAVAFILTLLGGISGSK